MKQILTILLLIANMTLFAQTLYTRKDTLAITQDSVTLQAGQFHGTLQWQHSPDGKTWQNLPGKTCQLLRIAKTAEGYYRAEIVDETCLPAYSDTAWIKTGFAISKQIEAQTGGVITTLDSSILTIPAHALQIDGEVTISTVEENDLPPVLNDNFQRFGNAYTLEIPGDTLYQNITLTLSLDSLPPSIENYIICLYDGISYFPMEYTIHGNTVIITIDIIKWNRDSLKKISLKNVFQVVSYVGDQSLPPEVTGLKEVTLMNGALQFMNPTPISDPAKVLLLIHGWTDCPQTWTKFIGDINSQVDVKFDKIWTFGYNSSHRINENGEKLLDELTKYAPQAKVKIIGHSMGGLVARSMIENHGGDRYVRKLITLGTPHLGSPLGAIRNIIGTGLLTQSIYPTFVYNHNTQGFQDLSVLSFFILKLSTTSISPVPYYCIAGVNLPSDNKLIIGQDDYAVGLSSALGAPTPVLTNTFEIEGSTGDWAHNRLLIEPRVFNQAKEYLADHYILKVLQGNNQVGIGGQKLPYPIIIQVLDELNKPVKNVPVYFQAAFHPGNYSSVSTNEEGKVAVEWTLDNIAGPQKTDVYLQNDKGERINESAIVITSECVNEGPSISTYSITDITESTAMGGGYISDNTDAPITARGLCWNTTGSPTVADSKTMDGSGTGSFISSIRGLSPNQKYFVKAYAISNQDVIYGNQVDFTTPAALPKVITALPTSITDHAVIFNAQVTDNGGLPVTERGFRWCQGDKTPSVNDATATVSGDIGQFSKTIDTLLPKTLYSYQAFATNSKGTAYGAVMLFATDAEKLAPTVTTIEATDITKNTAILNGRVDADNNSAITERGFYYGKSNNLSPENRTRVLVNGTTGGFNIRIDGLEANTVYYFCAFAKNSMGETAGEIRNFTTLPDATLNGTFTDPRDGKTYQWVKVGDQTWMAENLAYLPSVTPEYYNSRTELCYYDHDVAAYGALYNWPAASCACPSGWHLPTNAEWDTFNNTLGHDIGTVLSNGLGGYHYYDHFSQTGVEGNWWTATEYDTFSFLKRRYFPGVDGLASDPFEKQIGYSVRCVKGAIQPSLSTKDAGDITPSSAMLNGQVTSDGGASISERGFYWGVKNNMGVINWNKVVIEVTGDFSYILTGLADNTTYYFMAYAINSAGEGLGEQIAFKTSEKVDEITFNPNLSYGSVTDIDGNSYKTIQIGSQTWMAENLKVTHYQNGDPIQDGQDLTIWRTTNEGAYCEIPLPDNGHTYGKLYNWFAGSDPRNIAPSGWHVPTYDEWNTLMNYLNGVLQAGGAMKEAGTNHWISPNKGADNSSGFTGLPGGFRADDGSFGNQGFSNFTKYWGYFWSSGQFNDAQIWQIELSYNYNYATIGNNNTKRYGFSVRCIKDSEKVIPTLNTITPHNITSASAMGGGSITSDGGSPITAYGICWNTTGKPTLSDNKTINNDLNRQFTAPITGLTPDTYYYMRAYATNAMGTAYGNEEIFKTTTIQTGTFTDPRDQKTYQTVTIGDQTWLAENLAYLPEVMPSTNTSLTEPAYYVYGYNATDVNAAKTTTNYSTHGVLYNWVAATTACPPGWHLPTDEEWKELEFMLGMSQPDIDKTSWRGTDQALCLKSTSSWSNNGTSSGNGNNYSGFNATASGSIGSLKLGMYAIWWSSSEVDSSNVWSRILAWSESKVAREMRIKTQGLSVRCVKDN